MKRILSYFPFLFLIGTLFAQVPSVVEHIRFPLWAELDAYPELVTKKEIETEGQYDFPINSVKKVAPFLINGMVYGWNFVYVPSDKARGVEEYMEVTEIENLEHTQIKIEYSSPWLENNRFNCWVDCERTEFQIQNYYLWSSIQNPTIHGRGYAKLSEGIDGIQLAAEDALKNAVREYYRAIIKNKPKEISGSVLIRKVPVLGIDAGRYVINLDFFLECGRIIEYTQF